MKTLENRIHFTLFAKALAAFILIMLPICFMSVMINVWGLNNVRKEQMESARIDIQLYYTGIEAEFRNALRQQLSLVDNPDMTFIASAEGQYDDIDYYKSSNTVRKMLTEIKDYSPIITEAAAYIPSKQAMLSTAKGFTDLPEDYGQIKSIAEQGLYPFTQYKGDILSCVTSNFLLSSGDDHSYIISIRFSKEKILSELQKQESGSKQRKAALISTNHGITMMAEADPAVRQALAEFALAQNSNKQPSGTGTLKAGNRTLIVSWAKSPLLQTMLLFYLPEEQFAQQLAAYRTWIIALSILAVAGIFLFSVWMRRMFITPLKKLAGAYQSLEKGDFNVTLQYRSNDEFGVLYKRSNEMIKRLRNLIEQVYEQRIHAREAELKQLQYQISPHFLYNSILIIGNLIKMTDYECAGKLAFHLGNYYQYLTKGADFVPIRRETEHAGNYIEIQTIRFADRFVYQFDPIPPGLENLIVPRLILQPIIENTFKYGLANTVSGGVLHIGMAYTDGILSIMIEDNGRDLTDGKIHELAMMTDGGAQLAESTGLMNVHRRIQIKFGRGSGLYFSRSLLGGLCVEIRICEKEETCDVQPSDR